MDVVHFIKTARRRKIVRQNLGLKQWTLDRYLGEAPLQEFLLEGLFPMAAPSMVAAMGDTGKGLLLLDLAMKVDGVRFAYAFWNMAEDMQEKVFCAIGQPLRKHALFQGAVVKSNSPTDRRVRTYLRSATSGLLIDISEKCQ